MASLDVFDKNKKKTGSVEVSDSVFGAKVNVALVQQVLNGILASRRQGTHKVKTKGEVRGGGKKPYRQKGTGNARRGSQRSPLVVGGGNTHGPQPRSYEKFTSARMIRGALRSALSDRAKENRILVIDNFKLEPKTKAFATVVKKNFGLEKVLVIDNANPDMERAGRNVRDVTLLRTPQVNVYDIIRNEWILISKDAVQALDTNLKSERNRLPKAKRA